MYSAYVLVMDTLQIVNLDNEDEDRRMGAEQVPEVTRA